MKKLIFNNYGAHHIILSMIIAIIFLTGVWYLYKSYEDKKLKENMEVVYQDYKRWTLSLIKNDKDKEEVNKLFTRIQEIVEKNRNKDN